ncbi:uncharacterized protein N7473_011131 [Penicillium subrubescens]|uniref:uncharacterized protein n=1 Tax=Penicillium subrubescens TaxID=1316194 RepID=UPI0025452E63|nr:uncharacterized protein N7473_011131 [Penicillium subrubescens]KAJ5882697.1 hypothetical protein N7473_011131 [Penicillium subrubescens]
MADAYRFPQRFPSLSPDDAYLALHHEMLIKHPTEMAKIIGLDGIELVSIALTKRDIPSLIRMARLGTKVAHRFKEVLNPSPVDTQRLLNTLTPNVGPIAPQSSVGIPRDLPLAPSGPSNSAVVGFETEAPNSSGDVVKNSPVALWTNANTVSEPSSLSRVNYLECWNASLKVIQAAQTQQAIKALNAIADYLADSNCIAVCGSGGSDGFARLVYDFIKMTRKTGRIIVSSFTTTPRTGIRDHPLPPEFVNKPGNDLDHMCLFMLEVRQKLLAEDPKSAKAIVFHLLIPSCSEIQIKEPLHFPEDLFPLQIEGMTYKGAAQVKLNLPAVPASLLYDVANILDPAHWNAIAQGTSIAVGAPACIWGIPGAATALDAGLGLFTGPGWVYAGH